MPEAATIVKDIKINTFDERHLGKEPSWGGVFNNSDIAAAYNWYNYVLDDKQRQKIVADYVGADDKSFAKAILALDAYRIPNSLAAKCRMSLRGLVFDPAMNVKFRNELEHLVEAGNAKLGIATIPKVVVPMKAPEKGIIGTIENALDAFVFDQSDHFNCAALLRSKNATAEEAQEVATYYTRIRGDIDLAVKGKIEGYEHFGKVRLKEYQAFINAIIDAAGAHERELSAPAKTKVKAAKATVRKERKKKPVSAAKLVARVKFLKSHDDLTSIEPEKIIGAKELWSYNTKSRQLQYYVALDEAGLSVKGTSLQNWDTEVSEMRKIRKPEEIASLLQGGAKSVLKTFHDLRVKAIYCNGRLNEHTMILRANK